MPTVLRHCSTIQATPLRPARYEPLRRAGYNMKNFLLPQKPVLNLRVHPMKPLFSAIAFFLIKLNLALHFRDTIFGGAELVGKLLRHLKGLLTICFSHTGGFMKQFQNGLSGSVELISVIGSGVFWRKRHHGI
jgi:hypothetical protein